MQEILVILFFLSAAAYLGWRVYLQLTKKSDCNTACGCEQSVLAKKAK